jgi:hypothetical protein
MTTFHLTHEQLCDVLLASSGSAPQGDPQAAATCEIAEKHLRSCLQCAAELQNLRTSFSLFRHATTSYADQVYAQSSINKTSLGPAPRYGSHLLYWATAAALALAVALPLGLHHQHPPTAHQPVAAAAMAPQPTTSATESDEALLNGIAQDLSTDVPSPMQPLADPTDGAATVEYVSVQRKN